MDNKLKFKINYKNMAVFSEKNTENPEYPLLLSIPHSGTYFPPEFLKNVLSDVKTLRRNEDLLVDELVKEATDHGLPTMKMEVARSFVDLNRDKLELDPSMFYNYPNDTDVLFDKHCRVGLGVVHRINFQRENLYGLKKFGFCLVLDCHSMPSKICSIIDDRSGIDICLGNLFSQSCPQDISDFFAGQFWNKNYNVEFNCPYSGAFITFNYCQPRRNMWTLQLEVNRALYADEAMLAKNELFDNVANDISEAIINLAENIKRR